MTKVLTYKFPKKDLWRSTLTEEEVRQLDREIDEQIPYGIISDWALDTTVIDLLRLFEPTLLVNGVHEKMPFDRYRDALFHILNWSYEACQSPCGRVRPFRADRSEAYDFLFKQALQYSRLYETMNTIWNGWNDASIKPDGTVEVRFRSIRSVNWIEANRAEAAHKFGLKLEDMEGWEIRPLVITKHQMLSSYVVEIDVTIINEYLLFQLLVDQQFSLKAVWDIAYAGKYLPIKDSHYTTKTTTLNFGKKKFDLDGFALRPASDWKLSDYQF